MWIHICRFGTSKERGSINLFWFILVAFGSLKSYFHIYNQNKNLEGPTQIEGNPLNEGSSLNESASLDNASSVNEMRLPQPQAPASAVEGVKPALLNMDASTNMTNSQHEVV